MILPTPEELAELGNLTEEQVANMIREAARRGKKETYFLSYQITTELRTKLSELYVVTPLHQDEVLCVSWK